MKKKVPNEKPPRAFSLSTKTGTFTTALGLAILAGALMAVAPFAQAQQITGTPGAPSATTTIDGKQLPPPDPRFGGVIKDLATDSKPY